MVQFDFSVASRPQRPYGLLRDGEPSGVHLDIHTSPELCYRQFTFRFSVASRPQKPYGLLGTSTSTFTQHLTSAWYFFLHGALHPQ